MRILLPGISPIHSPVGSRTLLGNLATGNKGTLRPSLSQSADDSYYTRGGWGSSASGPSRPQAPSAAVPSPAHASGTDGHHHQGHWEAGGDRDRYAGSQQASGHEHASTSASSSSPSSATEHSGGSREALYSKDNNFGWGDTAWRKAGWDRSGADDGGEEEGGRHTGSGYRDQDQGIREMDRQLDSHNKNPYFTDNRGR